MHVVDESCPRKERGRTCRLKARRPSYSSRKSSPPDRLFQALSPLPPPSLSLFRTYICTYEHYSRTRENFCWRRFVAITRLRYRIERGLPICAALNTNSAPLNESQTWIFSDLVLKASREKRLRISGFWKKATRRCINVKRGWMLHYCYIRIIIT